MEIFEACRFLEDVIGIPVTLIESPRDIASFCNRNFFHHAQDPFIFSYVDSLVKEIPNNTIMFMEDRLLIKYMIIRTEQELLFLGPYINKDMTEANVLFLKRSSSLDDLDTASYRAYRNHYFFHEDSEVLHHALTLLKHTGHDPYRFVQTHNYNERSGLERSWEYQRRNFENLVNERYRIEQEMMEEIAEGDDVAAIISYRKIHNNTRFMVDTGSAPDVSRISAGITRATVRMAAVEAGLSPLIIDRISGESSRTIQRLTSREEMYRENERMIRAFAQAIGRYRKEKYSSVVFSAIDMFEHDYSMPISIEETAMRLGMSVSAFIGRFRKETGDTPNVYLQKYRIRIAKRLLRSSQDTIQEIAEKVGIPDANYFVKCFKKISGTTPSAYRSGYYNDQAGKKTIKKEGSR